jgi:hypothetical protein
MKIVSLSRAGAIAALASTAVAAAPAVIAPVASAHARRPLRSGAPAGPRSSVTISVGRPVFGPVAPRRH